MVSDAVLSMLENGVDEGERIRGMTMRQGRFACKCGWFSRLVVYAVGALLVCPRCGRQLGELNGCDT